MKIALEGIFPALLTAFTKNGAKVDYERTCALADRLATQGVHGLFVCGTTGEGLLMRPDERKQLIEELVAAVGRKLELIAHTGCLDTATTVELTRHALDVGAVAAGIVAPGFYTYDRASLLAHYKRIANAVDARPILMYNLPSCAKNLLTPDLILELASSVDNIVGIKDSTGDVAALNQILAGMPKGFCVINGRDEVSYEAYLAGARGTVSSTANVVSELFLNIFNNVRKGDLKKAWSFQVKLSRACNLFRYGAMVAYYKEGLRLCGFDAGYVRPPQRELTAAERKAFHAAVRKEGLV